MKKYFVIGNPIDHSLSPKLHSYWIKQHNIKATYSKKKINNDEIENLILGIRENKIDGINVTVPFKKSVIPFLDELSPGAIKTQSVNTVLMKNHKVIGHNTDIDGFKNAINNINYSVKNKKIFILGAGGVVPSIVYALIKMNVSKIFISNRTIEKAESVKNLFSNIEVLPWGNIPDFDLIINGTSIGLNSEDKINLDFSNIGKNKLFYDVIYNPKQTNFLKIAKTQGNKFENGMSMFLYQALFAFKLWHSLEPEINDRTINLLNT